MAETGEVGVLNVGAGDNKLVFDKNDAAGMIRAARIVEDMLKRGYALLVEVEVNGQKKFQRIKNFDPERCEYIIADLDPLAAADADKERKNEEAQETQPAPEGKPRRGRPRRTSTRAIPAHTTRAVAVAPTAGG